MGEKDIGEGEVESSAVGINGHRASKQAKSNKTGQRMQGNLENSEGEGLAIHMGILKKKSHARSGCLVVVALSSICGDFFLRLEAGSFVGEQGKQESRLGFKKGKFFHRLSRYHLSFLS